MPNRSKISLEKLDMGLIVAAFILMLYGMIAIASAIKFGL